MGAFFRTGFGTLVASCLLIASINTFAAFGGQPPLGPDDSLRHLLRPYDLLELNYLGMNYCQNLLDVRSNLVSYTHLGFDSPTSDSWNLQFPDDNARLLEGITWEDEYSSVVRIELARRIMKGLVASHIPGTKGYYSFRNRIAGKTYLIFDDAGSDKQGRLMASIWGDSLSGMLKIGFRTQTKGKWQEINDYTFTQTPTDAANPSVARNNSNWNRSPYIFTRHYTTPSNSVDVRSKYWMSDEDKPLEFGFTSRNTDNLQVVIGEPGIAMPLMGDSAAPGIIHLPDGKTEYSSTDGDRVINNPAFKYLILRKQTAWACPGYSTALLVMWSEKSKQIEALKENGFGQIKLTFNRRNAKVWVYPYLWVDQADMGHIYRDAEQFLKTGKLMHNGYPSQQLVNAIPAGLAAGAYLLTRYSDPYTPTARVNAQAAVDALIDGESQGRTFIRIFFTVRAAAWMVKLAKELKDPEMIAKYTLLLNKTAKRMMSPELGYDGKGWSSGWDHFNALKAVWLAYDATGNTDYLDAYNRAQSVYTIDEAGIYKYDKAMAAPGGFETYFGSMPLGAWGHAGKLDFADKLINLSVPADSTNPNQTLKDLWNDAGAGPWAQDDANPEYVGFALKGVNIPVNKKHILPLGVYPIYDSKGNVDLSHDPIVENPFSPTPNDPLTTLEGDNRALPYTLRNIEILPGGSNELTTLAHAAGKVENDTRTCRSKETLVYKLDTTEAIGAAMDIQIEGNGYTVDVSPDGKKWFRRLDSWSEKLTTRSADFSFLTGSKDELVKVISVSPPDDKAYLIQGKSSKTIDGRRYIGTDGIIYKLDLPMANDCRVELIISPSSKVACSNNARDWSEQIDNISYKASVSEGIVRIINPTALLTSNKPLYMKITNPTPGAFIDRLTAYASFDCPTLFVRLSNIGTGFNDYFRVGKVKFRIWGR